MKKKKERFEKYPQVVYGNRKIKREVLAYLKYLGCPSFRIILKDLGFTKDDTVYLYGAVKNMEYLYSVNEKTISDENQMRFNYGLFLESTPYIVVKNNDEEIKYHCVKSEIAEDEVWFEKYHYVKKYSDNRKYTRHYSMYGYYSSIVKDGYKLNVSLYDGVSVYDNEDIKIIQSEKELEEYLVNLEFPVKIDEVYKRIYEIIGQEIDKYLTLKIEVSNEIYTNNDLRKYNTTDIIKLDNGELVEFGMTMDNRTIFIDKDDNWSYKITKDDGKTVCYSLASSNGNLDYKVNNSDNKDFQMVFSQNLEEARSEVENAKTKCRSVLKK